PAAEAALFHHRPRDYLTKLVTVADWLSSGERDDLDVHAGVPAAQLRSLFSRVALDPSQGSAPRYYGLEPLALDEQALFPRDGLLSEAERQTAYRALWDSFVAELGRLPPLEPLPYLETLTYL